MKVKKTYRLEQETIEELEKLCSDSGKSATEVIEGAIHDAIHVPDVERIGDGWAQTVAALTDQLAVKDDQIASLGRALEAAQETAKAAQALHAANVQERALESSEQKESRRWRWPWDRQDVEGVLRQDAGLMNAPATLLEQHPGACYNARQSVPRPPGQHRLTD